MDFTSRARQSAKSLGAQKFVVNYDIAAQIKVSRWNTRGWTYRELLLSRRRLVFTDSEMYFQFLESNCLESLHPYFTAPRRRMYHLRVFPEGYVGRHSELNHRLKEYFVRGISFKADTINAVVGIFNAFDALAKRGNHFGEPLLRNSSTYSKIPGRGDSGIITSFSTRIVELELLYQRCPGT